MPPYPDWLRPEFVDRVDLAHLVEPVEAPATLRHPSIRRRYESIFVELHARSFVDFERIHAWQGLSFSDPWSDRQLSEFVLAIPQGELHRPSDYKRLARLSMVGLVPENARRRLGKGRMWPLAQYALQRGARDTITRLITDSEVVRRGYVDNTGLKALYEAAGRGERANGLFEILLLEDWLRRYWR